MVSKRILIMAGVGAVLLSIGMVLAMNQVENETQPNFVTGLFETKPFPRPGNANTRRP